MMGEQTVLVCGGTGFLGKYVVQRLVHQGYRVRVLTRGEKEPRPLSVMGAVGQVACFPLRTLDEASVAPFLKGCVACINLIGILCEKKNYTFDLVHKKWPKVLGQAAHDAGIKRFLHVSALVASSSASRYAQSKKAGEEALKSVFPEVTLFRPSVLFGPEDDFFNRFATMAFLCRLLPVIYGDALYQPVFVDDVAQAIVCTLENPQTKGCVYDLGGPDTISFKDMMHAVFRWIHREGFCVPLPIFLAKLAALLCTPMARPFLTLDQIKLLKEGAYLATDNGFAALGIVPQSMERVVPSYLERFQPHF